MFDLSRMSLNDWLATDMQFLHEARTAVSSFREGQRAGKEAAERKAAM